jgi:Chaperone of endosialidase
MQGKIRVNQYSRQFCAPLLNALLCASLAATPGIAAANGDAAIASRSPNGVYWQVTVPNDGVSLRVTMPDGSVAEQEHPRGQAPWFASKTGGALPDGNYVYEMVIAPILSPSARAQALSSRESGRPVVLPAGTVQSGVFQVVGGVVLLPDPAVVEPRAPVKRNTASAAAGNRGTMLKDQVIADDLIVQGSACVGLDCVNNESFGFDTIRLKENNTRIKFEDTSAVAGFPANDWQLTGNDSASGGANKFSIEDITGAKVPFTITAGAATNSIFVDSTGRVGLRTATPVLDLQIATGNTPATRLEQNSAGGFSAQTWDVAGNEANFFVRDVTSGSRLPFRIRPGAPTSSIDISASGNVGIGTASPDSALGDTLQGTTLRVHGSSAYGLLSITNTVTGSGATMGRITFASTGYSGLDKRTALLLSSSETAATDNPTGNLRFFTNGAGTLSERMRIDGAGNVGIGTPAPTDKLSVNGTASKPGGGSWATFSDERLKNVKGRFSSGLEAIMQLQPLRYEYKPNNALYIKSGLEHVGFGAQAVQRIIPEAVTRNENGYLMVNNDPILWTMLNAIKEQQDEIAQLKEKVRRLLNVRRKLKQ